MRMQHGDQEQTIGQIGECTSRASRCARASREEGQAEHGAGGDVVIDSARPHVSGELNHHAPSYQEEG